MKRKIVWRIAAIVTGIAWGDPAGACRAAWQDRSVEASSDSAQWGQFRGPDGNGSSTTARPPTRWSNSQNVRWKVAIPGGGHSSPVVWNDRVYLLTAVPTGGDAAAEPSAGEPAPGRGGPPGRGMRRPPPDKPYEFTVLCLNRADGAILWQTIVKNAIPKEGGHPTNTHASASPVTDGKHIYAFFGSYGLYCLDLDGKVVWERDLGQMQTRNSFGEGSSPALYDNTLVVTWDHEGPSFIEAMDASTGKTLWKVDRDEPTSWATPRIIPSGDSVQVVTNGTRALRSYDLKTGKLIWECGGMTANPIPTPMTDGELVYCMTGYQGFSIQAIRLGAQGDVTGSQSIVWSRQDAAPYVPSAVLYRDLIYFTKSREGILFAVDAKTGKTLIDQTRLDGIQSIYASLVAADDKIYVSGREGVTAVLEYGPQLKILASNDLGEPIDATPALVGDEIFIRGHQHLFCIGE